jgi:signal recognition particle receptor subunit beta
VENLKLNLSEQGFDAGAIPYVLQLNKRDLPMVLSSDQLRKDLAFRDEPVFEAVAADGTGVFETLKGVIKQVLLDLKNR